MMRYRGNCHDLATNASKLGGGPISVCDYSGFLCNKSDMISQMEYNGAGLYNTGYMVHKKFADIPNPQALSPILGIDPQPIMGVTFDTQGLGQPELDTIEIEITKKESPLLIDQWTPSYSFTFTGVKWDETSFSISFINTIFQMWFINKSLNDIIIDIQGFPFRSFNLKEKEKKLLSYNMIEIKEIVL